METIKNLDGKTICRADLRNKRIEIVFKGNRSFVWFDRTGQLQQIHEVAGPYARAA